MVLTTPPVAAPLRRSQRLLKALIPSKARTFIMANHEKEDIHDTYEPLEPLEPLDPPLADPPELANNSSRWSFLENGINSVMLKLDDGIDMKTVCSFG